nr:protein IL-40 isoform X1 [Manis javanica]
MSLLLLLCSATLATSSFPAGQEVEITLETFIAYRVLEVFPRGRRVLITCHSPQASPPVTYTLWGSQDTEVAKKVVKTRDPASFSINITLKSRPELLTYSCQAASNWGVHRTSAKLQMYWELWANPVSQLQADFTLLDRGAGPRVEISCQASLGSPPITYSLVRKDGHVHMQQRPNHGQPANFSFPLTQTSDWFQCQAENNDSCPRHPPSCWLAALPPLQLSPLGCWAGLSGPGRKWCWVWGHSELLLACVNPRGPGWRAAGSAFVGQGCHQGEERTISLMHDFQVFKPYCVLSAC